jgi:CxxC motif-containing protein (DUF1111 family)
MAHARTAHFVVAGLAFAITTASVGARGDIVVQPPAGDPLQGLSPAEQALFDLGRDRFEAPATVGDGLGPVFNKASCAACHQQPVGGGGVIASTYFGAIDRRGFDPLVAWGGPLLQSLAISASCEEWIDDGATVFTTRLTIGMLGYGLIEAIPDSAILALEDPDDLDGDGVRGRAQLVLPIEAPRVERVGRFGSKAQWATIMSATAQSALDQIGLTNRHFPIDHAPGGNAETLDACDDVADPEIVADGRGVDDLDRLAAFQRFLAAPPQTPKSGMRGEAIFLAIGCATCHTPSWTTADDPALPDVLRAVAIRPYSNFLVHQMGVTGDPIPEGQADVGFVRTPPLWNLRARSLLWHDGRVNAATWTERIAGRDGAIALHDSVGSEGASSAQAFFALPERERLDVVAFLDSLGRREFDADGDGDLDEDDVVAFVACRGATDVTPDDPCAIHDIDADGVIGRLDAEAFVDAGEFRVGDCDTDGIADLVEVLLGAPDLDGDLVPDDCVPCAPDIDRSGTVGAADLGLLLGAWGTPAIDFDGNGITDADDLATLLGAWGPCP